MKLASYRDGSRDGQLVVVSRDLRSAHYASGTATRLQQVLDDWNFVSPQLEELARGLEQGRLRHAFAFDPAQCMAPLPRAHQRAALASGSVPPGLPRLVQHPGDASIGPCDPVHPRTEAAGVDFALSIVAATGDVPRGVEASSALESVRLLLLACDLVESGDGDPAAGEGPLLATAFAAVAVTPDELEGDWRAGRVHRTFECRNGAAHVGRLDAGATPFDFGATIAALASHRGLGAGSLVGSAALRESADGAREAASIAGPRVHAVTDGRAGSGTDEAALRVDGGSVFGSIEPRLVLPARQSRNTRGT